MELAEIREKKKLLEERIAKALDDFGDEAGVFVRAIEIFDCRLGDLPQTFIGDKRVSPKETVRVRTIIHI